ncbi:TRAP transporter substrate-binding protein [Rubellimicrobium sp. CFH 75288]|uniref:TRAP transporter substrate-binding protein n=1 Tax=Rubellimicrobium sp. CFH 75288 TaxID=2697034 RepID=UPI0014134A9C|nr:TRAP transporter substrate-binding protein [Rubellimicrobium sp. CFH 75288]NAZ36661.1 C4-dicarboxylate ABC transporter substrate-binding protein [Rubellimicrobium sp. CFH 75288]
MNRPLVRFALVAALASAASADLAEARELRIGLITPPPHVWTQVAHRMAETLPQQSGEALSLVVFPAGQLGSEQEMFQQLSTGLLDAAIMTAGVSSLRAPSMAGWFTPYLFEDVAAAAETPAAQEMLDQLQQGGVVGIGYTFAGMRHILMRDGLIEGPEDLANRKIRIVPFPAMQTWWQAVGAVPTPVNLGEVYSGLQNGLLDGIDIDLDALVGQNFQEVARSLTLTSHMAFPAVLVVWQVTWNGMTDAERAAFEAAADEALAWGIEQQIAAEAANLAALEGQIEIGRLEDGREAFAAANAAFEAQYGSDEIVRRFQEQARGTGE